jgi:hypothetical protein
MTKMMQAFVAVPISEAIGRAFGGNTMLGVGAALVTARLVMRSFPGMLLLGVVAGGLNYMHIKKIADDAEKSKSLDKPPITV